MNSEQVKYVSDKFNVKFMFDEEVGLVAAVFPDIRSLHRNIHDYNHFMCEADYEIPGYTVIPSMLKLSKGVHDATEEELGNTELF